MVKTSCCIPLCQHDQAKLTSRIMPFPSVFSLSLRVKHNGICVSDTCSCIITFCLPWPISLWQPPCHSWQLTEAADFQSEIIQVFYMHNFQSLIVNQFSVCFFRARFLANLHANSKINCVHGSNHPMVPFLCSYTKIASHSCQGQWVLGKAASETGPGKRKRLFLLYYRTKRWKQSSSAARSPL